MSQIDETYARKLDEKLPPGSVARWFSDHDKEKVQHGRADLDPIGSVLGAVLNSDHSADLGRLLADLLNIRGEIAALETDYQREKDNFLARVQQLYETTLEKYVERMAVLGGARSYVLDQIETLAKQMQVWTFPPIGWTIDEAEPVADDVHALVETILRRRDGSGEDPASRWHAWRKSASMSQPGATPAG